MKKLIVLVAFITTVFAASALGQPGGGDPAAMLHRYKERVKPQLIEKTKLTEAQADKVIEISFNSRSQMRGMRDLSEEDRKKKTDEMQQAQVKEFKAIPL